MKLYGGLFQLCVFSIYVSKKAYQRSKTYVDCQICEIYHFQKLILEFFKRATPSKSATANNCMAQLRLEIMSNNKLLHGRSPCL